jgi:hypothetical protein
MNRISLVVTCYTIKIVSNLCPAKKASQSKTEFKFQCVSITDESVDITRSHKHKNAILIMLIGVGEYCYIEFDRAFPGVLF